MKRRTFIAALGGAGVWPLVGGAQGEPIPRVGVLMPFPENDPRSQVFVTALQQSMASLGWDQDKNVRLEYRFAAGDPKLFEAYAAELVRLSPNVILASTTPAAVAVQQQTHSIPIVFTLVADPVWHGLVQSLARPSGNITGFSSYDAAMIGKWLQLLKEVAPVVMRVAVIFNPLTAFAPPLMREIEAAPSLGATMMLAPVHDDESIEQTIAAQAREPGGGLIILPDSFNTTHRDAIVAGAVRYSLPLIGVDIFPRAGGLMSYWYDSAELHAQAASYIDRILKGASPADLPVQYPTKYSLIINLKTAKALGLTVPPRMLDLADEVIE